MLIGVVLNLLLFLNLEWIILFLPKKKKYLYFLEENFLPEHHHLAMAIIFLIAGHMYRTNWGIGHGIRDILEAYKGPFIGQEHKGLYEILTTSWHAQLSINLAMLGSSTIVVAHHIYLMPSFPYLATDYGTQLSLFTHHMWIGGSLNNFFS